MIVGFFKGLLALIVAFGLGVSAGSSRNVESDSELKQKVQEHMDVIVDEAAAIADEVTEEIRANEHVQEAESFVDDVNEIIDNTIKDIEDHFGKKDEEETVVSEEIEESAAAEEEEETVAEETAAEETEEETVAGA